MSALTARDMGGRWKRLLAAAAALAVVAATALVVLHREREQGRAAQTDTHVQMIVNGYKEKFPWSAEMMDALTGTGVVTTPESVTQMFMLFITACVGGKDMRAGHPEATAQDLAAQNVYVTAEQAQRLNAAQEKMCAAMPQGAWNATPTTHISNPLHT